MGRFPQRGSLRLRNYDYAKRGVYFVTICTHQRQCLFGEVTGGAVWLNRIGCKVEECWLAVPGHFRGVELDARVVMPNHIHGVVVIHKRAQHAAPLHAPSADAQPSSKVIPGSLSAMVRSFKSAVTQSVRRDLAWVNRPFWQRNYYEHVVRDGQQLDAIRRYIWENPGRWEFDRENPAARSVENDQAWL